MQINCGQIFMKSFHEKLTRIRSVFDTKSILNAKIDLNSIRRYYKINKWAYTIFHSRENLIHLGISKDMVYKKADLLESVKFIGKYIKNNTNFKVLELGTGRGANCKYLAKTFCKTQFVGVDISLTQLGFAKRIAHEYPNYQIYIQDFHDLSRFKDSEFDIVFEIEALCNSAEKERVLQEVGRVLKKNGIFILVDGWLVNNRESYTEDEQEAFRLVEIGMSLKDSDTYQHFKEIAAKEGYSVDFEENDSQYILPTTNRTEAIARLFFTFSFIARMMTRFLPKEFLYNAITGYLWGDMMKRKITCYYLTVLKK